MLLPFLTDAELDAVKAKHPRLKTCPTCEGTLSYRLYGKNHPCDCSQQMRLNRHYLHANIGYVFQTATWDDFISDDRDRLLDSLQTYVESFAGNYRYGRGWTLCGDVGTGKTMLMCLTLKDLIKSGRSAYFIQARDLTSDIATISPERAETMRRLRSVDILGIDDLSDGLSKAHVALIEETLESVVRFRYNNALPTLITTNLSHEKQEEVYPRLFSVIAGTNDLYQTLSKLNARIVSRYSKIGELIMNKEVLPIV